MDATTEPGAAESLTFVRPGVYRTAGGERADRVARIDLKGAGGASRVLYAPGHEDPEYAAPLTAEEGVKKAWAQLRWREESVGGWDEAVITMGDGEPTIRLAAADKVRAYRARIDRVRVGSPEAFPLAGARDHETGSE